MSNIGVHVRLRPSSQCCVEFEKKRGGTVRLKHPTRAVEQEFQFDAVWDGAATQADVFQEVSGPAVAHCLDGYNATVFAYGQTGSGKTYSIFGEGDRSGEDKGTRRGMLPRSMETIFLELQKQRSKKKISLFVSFVEIYQEKLRDLGAPYVEAKGAAVSRSVSGGSVGPTSSSESLNIRENKAGETYVQDLSLIAVTTLAEVMAIVESGLQHRQTYETRMNEVSSRSHTVFTLHIVQKDRSDSGVAPHTSRLNLVDLAGSERLDKSGSEGVRKQEAIVINKSLSALGNVVMALQRSDYSHIPYRDSKLTRLLQDSLGGNSYTTLIATLNPAPEHYEECLNTMLFANRCAQVQNVPQVNYLASSDTSPQALRALMEEVSALKAELGDSERRNREMRSLLEGKLDLGADNQTLTRMLGLSTGGFGGKTPKTSVAVDPIRALESISSKVEEKGKKLAASREENLALQAEMKKSADKTRADYLATRHRDAKKTKELEARTQQLECELYEAHEIHETAAQEAELRHKGLMDDMSQRAIDVSQSFRFASRDAADMDETLKGQSDKVNSRWNDRYQKLGTAKNHEIAGLKKKYEWLLENKGKEMRRFVNEYEAFRASSGRTNAQFTAELRLMHDYATSLSTVVQRFVSGAYPVRDKGGIKTFVLPKNATPEQPSIERVPLLRKLLGNADRYLGGQEDPDAWLETDIVKQGADPAMMSEVAAMGNNDLRAELLRLMSMVAETEEEKAAMRAEIQSEVLTELRSHETAEYIRSLEAERDAYRGKLKRETRRAADQRVAMASQSRQMNKLQTSSMASLSRSQMSMLAHNLSRPSTAMM